MLDCDVGSMTPVAVSLYVRDVSCNYDGVVLIRRCCRPHLRKRHDDGIGCSLIGI